MLTRINLLPTEYRRRERTPLSTFLPLLLSVTVALGTGAFWAWLHFGELAQAQGHQEELEANLATKRPLLTYVADLRGEISEYKERAKTIQQIAASRVPWTRKLDELCEVITDDHNGERYLVWLNSMEVKAPDGRAGTKGKAAEGEQISIEGLCFAGLSDESDPLQRFNNFHEAIKHSQFFRDDFIYIANPAGQSKQMDDDLKPTRAWTVSLPLTMAARQPTAKTGQVAEQQPKKSK